MKSNNLPPKLVFWFIWPFGALINSLSQYKTKNAQFIFWLFCVFFGLAFVFPKDMGGIDAGSYVQKLITMHEEKTSFMSLINSFYVKEGIIDIYQPLITWLVAIFTKDPRWLFGLFGAVFGYFYAQNIWILLKNINIQMTSVIFLYVLGFALINPIWNINGVRMWTAAQVFLYGIMLYFLQKKKKGLLWCASSILFHFSFLFPLAILLLFLILPKNYILYFSIFVVLSFFVEFNIAGIRSALLRMPDVFHERIIAYTHEDIAIKLRMMTRSWHVELAALAARIFSYSWAIWLFLKRKHWVKTIPFGNNIFHAFLLFGGLAQAVQHVPSGGRFSVVSNSMLFLLIVCILGSKDCPRSINIMALLTSPLLIIVILFSIRLGTQYFSFLTIFGNPILAFLFDEQKPLIDIIKSLF